MFRFCGLLFLGIWFQKGRGGAAFPRRLHTKRKKAEAFWQVTNLSLFAEEEHMVPDCFHLQWQSKASVSDTRLICWSQLQLYFLLCIILHSEIIISKLRFLLRLLPLFCFQTHLLSPFPLPLLPGQDPQVPCLISHWARQDQLVNHLFLFSLLSLFFFLLFSFQVCVPCHRHRSRGNSAASPPSA